MLQRKNGEFATTAILTQAAINSALGEQGHKEFKKIIDKLLADED